MVCHGHAVDPELSEGSEDPVEYVDGDGQLLMLAPASRAFPLRRKAVGVLLYDTRGRMVVRRNRLDDGTELWGMPAAAFVRFGESREQAAERALKERAGLSAGDMQAEGTLKNDAMELQIFRIVLPEGETSRNGILLDAEERHGMAEAFPELLSPALLWAIRAEAGEDCFSIR